MKATKKSCSTFLLIFLVASSLPFMQSVSGASKPSTPEVLSVVYVDCSYDVAPAYGTDQYTGQTVVKQDGYHVDNRSIQFTIKNQPFTPYLDPSGNQIVLYYNFRIKGAYGTEWDYYPFGLNGWTTSRYGGWLTGGNSTGSPTNLAQSTTEFTTLTIRIPGVYRVPMNAELQVEMQAMVGYMYPTDYMMAGHVYVFVGQSSAWSITKTVTFGENSATTTPTSPTQTPSPTLNPTDLLTQNQTVTTGPSINPAQLGTQNGVQVGFDWQAIAVAILATVVAVLAAVVFFQRRKGRIVC